MTAHTFFKAPIIGRTHSRGTYAEGVVAAGDQELGTTFSTAVNNYGFLVAAGEELTGAQWISRIKSTYAHEPGERNAAVIEAIAKVMLTREFEHAADQGSAALQADLAAAGAVAIPRGDPDRAGWKTFVVLPYAFARPTAILVPDTPQGRDSLLWRMLQLLEAAPVGAETFSAAQGQDVEAQLALMQRPASERGYSTFVTNKPSQMTLQPGRADAHRTTSASDLAASLEDFISSLIRADWNPSPVFLCRPAPLVNPLASIEPYESLVHHQLVGWRLPTALVNGVHDSLAESDADAESNARHLRRCAPGQNA
jgi:hypothetical protein